MARCRQIAQSGQERARKVSWDKGAKVSKRALAPPIPCFAPAQPSISQLQKGFGPIAPKGLLHPLPTTLGHSLKPVICQDHSFPFRVLSLCRGPREQATTTTALNCGSGAAARVASLAWPAHCAPDVATRCHSNRRSRGSI